MASIRKKAGKWRVEVRRKGAYRSASFDSKLEAQAWAVEVEQGLGAYGSRVAVTRTLGEAMQRYAEEIAHRHKGERWERIRLGKLGKHHIASITLERLTRDDIQRWIDEQAATLSPGSINRELHLISAVLRVARREWRWMAHNPMTDLRKPKNPPPRDRRIWPKEEAAILAALEYDEAQPVTTIRQRIAVAWLLAIETAMRQGEIFGLEWDRVFLDRRFVRLPETKNGTARDVALSSRAVALLEALEPKERGSVLNLNQDSAGQIFRRAVEMAGVEDMTFHDSRHEAITRLAKKLDVLDLARMVGHRDIRSLRIYYNATAEEIAGRLD